MLDSENAPELGVPPGAGASPVSGMSQQVLGQSGPGGRVRLSRASDAQ